MFRVVLFFCIASVKGKGCFFSMLAMLENISLALTPEIEKLNHTEYDQTDELDTLAKQWSGVWDSVTKQLSFRKAGKQPVRELLAIAEHQSRVGIQVVDFEALSRGCDNSSIAQMLSCQRSMGDPSSAYALEAQLSASTIYLPYQIASNQTINLQLLDKKQETNRIKAQEDFMSLLCFFYLIQVKIKEVNYVFCLCSSLPNWRSTYLYGSRVTSYGWQRIRT
ncbi:hypothetical protein [Photobacterium sp. DNB22_13_2]